ncbi:hypothetical protein HOC01_05185 [archaeon]|jgi:hypothetical protein|nr:hypothetical protein [archaeon]MBT6698204.1 hypothetical protein [archaeon]
MVIEVEVRGPLSGFLHSKLVSHLKSNGRYVKRKERQMLCCMDVDELKQGDGACLDVRSKITNGVGELSIKKGKWGGSDSREEVSVYLGEGQYMGLVNALKLLGYDRVIWAERHSERYELEVNGSIIEFAIIEVISPPKQSSTVPIHSIFFEAEIAVLGELDVEGSEELVANAQEILNKVCSELGLSIFTDEQWYAHVDIMDKEANRVVHLSNQDDMAFVRKELERHVKKFS